MANNNSNSYSSVYKKAKAASESFAKKTGITGKPSSSSSVTPRNTSTGSNSYNYIDTSGRQQTIQANDPDTAIRMAVNRAPTSGVIRNVPTTPTTPAAPATPPVGNLAETPISKFYAPTPDNSGIGPYQDIDEDKVRREVLRQYQSQINATKASYASLMGETKQMGQGRLGESTAMQARGGLLGSDFGAAQTEGVRSFNAKQEQGVRESEAMAVSNIMAQAQQDANAQIAAKRAAKQYGYAALQEYNAGEQARKQNNLKKVASAMLLQGVDPRTMGAQLKELAKTYKVSENDIINAYLEEEKADSYMFGDKFTNLPASAKEYEYAKQQGYEGSYTDFTQKDESGLTPYQQFQATQSIAKDTQARTENAREMARQAELIQNSYQNILNGKDRSLNTQAIITSFNKILDPTSVVRESEYDRTAQGQSLLNQLQGKYQNIVEGGAGVTDKTIEEAANIAKQYLEGAKASVASQNLRAQQLAEQFGLNPSFVTSSGFEGGDSFEEQW